jgi:hypothetical protein
LDGGSKQKKEGKADHLRDYAFDKQSDWQERHAWFAVPATIALLRPIGH